MPPAKSAALGACGIRGPGSAAIVPAVLAQPPHEIRGGVGLAGCEDRRWRSLRSGTCFVPPQPPRWGGFNPPRPLPGGAEGGFPRPAIRAGPPQGTAGIVPAEMPMRIFSLQGAAPPAAPLVGGSAVPASIAPPGILPGGTAAVLAAAWSARRRPVGGRGPPPPSARPLRHGPPVPGCLPFTYFLIVIMS